MPTVTVHNDGPNPVEAAGRVWPPRRPTTAEVDERQLATIRAHRRLTVHDDGPAIAWDTVIPADEPVEWVDPADEEDDGG